MTACLTRRTLLATLALAPLGGCIVTGNPPLPHTRVRMVRVDVAPLVAKGMPGYAARVAALAEPALTRAFAGRLDRDDDSAPVVTVTIEEIHMAPTAGFGGGGEDGADGGSEMLDTVRGRLAVTATGRLPALARPLRADRSATDSGPWYAPDNEDRRLAALITDFAQWARREFPE